MVQIHGPYVRLPIDELAAAESLPGMGAHGAEIPPRKAEAVVFRVEKIRIAVKMEGRDINIRERVFRMDSSQYSRVIFTVRLLRSSSPAILSTDPRQYSSSGAQRRTS